MLLIKLQVQCLICHEPKEQIAQVIQDQLIKLYPDDEDTGFPEGELRGLFGIEKPSSCFFSIASQLRGDALPQLFATRGKSKVITENHL